MVVTYESSYLLVPIINVDWPIYKTYGLIECSRDTSILIPDVVNYSEPLANNRAWTGDSRRVMQTFYNPVRIVNWRNIVENSTKSMK